MSACECGQLRWGNHARFVTKQAFESRDAERLLTLLEFENSILLRGEATTMRINFLRPQAAVKFNWVRDLRRVCPSLIVAGVKKGHQVSIVNSI